LHAPRHRAQDRPIPLEFTTSHTKDATEVFKHYKRLGERAMEQAPDRGLVACLDTKSNSIAVIVKHLLATCVHAGPISLPPTAAFR
jgi:hypothetical protein